MTKKIQRSNQQWVELLTKSRFKPTKSMGQNFLTDTSVVADITHFSELKADDLVVEIGPGLGILTRQLIASGAEVIGVELDRELARFLRQDLAEFDRFRLVEQDARQSPLQGSGEPPLQCGDRDPAQPDGIWTSTHAHDGDGAT